MPNPDKPNQNADKSKAEGDRWSSDPSTVENVDFDVPAESYPPPANNDGDNAGGITNRPLDEEVDNQESLPGRGTDRESRRSER